MESSRVSLHPEKFTGKDWSFWKEQMKSVFMLEGLLEIVDGTLPEPANDEGNEVERAQWARKDSRALAMLKLLLDNSQLIIVLRCNTVKDAWQALVDRYEQPTMPNIVLHERKYRSYCKEAGKTFSIFIQYKHSTGNKPEIHNKH